MPIVVDRRYLENLIDILEGEKPIDGEVKEHMIAQGRRLVQVDIDKESGKLSGRPKKEKEIISFVEKPRAPDVRFCEFLALLGPINLPKRRKVKKDIKVQLTIDFGL